MHESRRTPELFAPTRYARAALFLRAIREFRRREGAKVGGGFTAGPAGLVKTAEILRAVSRLRYISAERIDSQANAEGFIAMLDPITPHSKASQIAAALEAHGMPRDRILAPRRVGPLGRLNLQMNALRVALTLRPWRRRLPAPDLTLTIAALVHARRLAQSQSTTVHIGDRSPRRIALATGAALAGRRSLYWQNGYHDRAIPDLGYSDAAVLSSAGEAAFAGRATNVWALDPPAAFALRLPARIERLGVATNAFAGPEIEAIREVISGIFPKAVVALRLHPRISQFDASRVAGWDVRQQGEGLEAFARSCDAVICGNTAAQIEILLAGVPVIHLAGLDPHGFDLYGYVARGISYGFTLPPQDPVEDVLGAFYRAPCWPARLRTEVSEVSAATPSLRKFISAIAR